VTTEKNDVNTTRFARAGKNDKVDGLPQPSKEERNQSSRRFMYTNVRSRDSAEQWEIRGIYGTLEGIYCNCTAPTKTNELFYQLKYMF
jgi:hypothetical protein